MSRRGIIGLLGGADLQNLYADDAWRRPPHASIRWKQPCVGRSGFPWRADPRRDTIFVDGDSRAPFGVEIYGLAG
jgi:hypothetical protein